MITLTVHRAENGREKMVGLIGKKKAYPFLLETHFGIHTFGVRFSIDVVILNNQNQIMQVHQDMQPWRVFFWNPRYKTVLELPAGTIKKKIIKKGDTIKLVIE